MELRDLQLDLAGLGVQLAFVMPGPLIGPSLGPLVALGVTEVIRLGVEHGVERLLHRRTHHLPEVLLDLAFIDFDDLTQVLLRLCRCTVLHR